MDRKPDESEDALSLYLIIANLNRFDTRPQALEAIKLSAVFSNVYFMH